MFLDEIEVKAVSTGINNVVTNAKFLQGAIHKFSPSDAMEFCQSNGLPSINAKTLLGKRVEPQRAWIIAFTLILQ